jgi:hypothetical protein
MWLATFDVRRARDAAWVNAQTLWTLAPFPTLQKRFLTTLDHTVGFAGRGLVLPIRPPHEPTTAQIAQASISQTPA